MWACACVALSDWQVNNSRQDKVFGSCGLQEETPQSGRTTRRFTRLQLDRIDYHRGLVKSVLSRLLHMHLGVTMSRRSSGGGDDIAMDEGQSSGAGVLFGRGGVSPPRLEHGETLTPALIATFTFWSRTTATKRL